MRFMVSPARNVKPQSRLILRLSAAFAFLFIAPSAWAQSIATLESLRLHKPNALDLAEQDYTACLAASCDREGELSLLVGVLRLASGNAPAALEALSGSPKRPPGLEAFFDFYLGEARFYAGDYS